MKTNRYIEDILDQPQALQQALAGYAQETVQSLARQISGGAFDRIILTGMGGSTFAGYPAWLRLTHHGLPAWWVDTSELLHYQPELVTPGCLLWIISQSGASAEIVALLDQAESRRPGYILGVTNQPPSPLGKRASGILELHAGEEFTVSTKSYLTTLAVMALAAVQLTGGDLDRAHRELQETVHGVEEYLQTWESRVEEWVDLLGVPQRLFILGRGPSYAAAKTAALITKESAKFPVEAMTTAQFRHGPLEMSDGRMSVILLAGEAKTRAMNEALAQELRSYGAQVVWLDHEKHACLPTVLLPRNAGAGIPVAEIIPLQLLTLALASQTGVEPGIFRHIGKVTRVE